MSTFKEMVEKQFTSALNEVDGQFAVNSIAEDPDMSFNTITNTLKHHDQILGSGKTLRLNDFYPLIQHAQSLTHEHKIRILKQMVDNNKRLATRPYDRESKYNMAGEREERALLGRDYNPDKALLPRHQ